MLRSFRMTIKNGKGQRRKILVVDDDILTQYAVQSMLEEQGYKVITANNGQEGVELFDAAVSGIIIDYQMPIMNGIQATQAIRKKEKILASKNPLYIIGLTGNTEKSIVNNLIKAGINIVFQKPLNRDDLEEIIKFFNSYT